jgi:3-methyladenine DNA glycosylase AlkD
MSIIVENIRKELIQNADEKVKASGERFFKENVTMYGLKSALVSSIGKEHFLNLADKSKSTVFLLCEEFWQSGYMEESFIAFNWSYYIRKQYEINYLRLF